ncbi:peptidase [Novosphingobium marinum]|uniref:Clan AA aspartic protease (TIGR02281 family) n=1 Tax=Novosphingobium marinum TaxID=1514948 RepID=A0A7Y9XZP5_9SPHN|nr:TIGR02281 family clan AA aspartic protease [Novosphingobium marinum]NYH96270.1 clan AA aspartic protease (TIGR02281 family) [Novosphingobium marinum]GGC33813.1 peptidase [Novosphingobium marinum]
MSRNLFLVLAGALAFAFVFDDPVAMTGTSAEADAPEKQGVHLATTANGFDREWNTVINRDPAGRFTLTAQVNGMDIPFLVDTGADIVALTVDEADNLGIYLDRNDMQPIMQTASGVGHGAEIRLDRLDVGGQEFRDVPAVVVEGLTVNLLGQSVLRRFGKLEMHSDRMVIHHK